MELFLLVVFAACLATSARASTPCDKVTFAPPQYLPTGGAPINVAVADFDGDGKQDFVINNDAALVVYLSDGGGGFRPTTITLGSYHQGLATGDFNGDGKPDIAVTNDYDHTVSILLNDGSGSFGSPITSPAGGVVNEVAVGDFNGDNKLDLAVIAGSNAVAILLGNGAGGFGPPTSYSTSKDPVAITVADFNNDGHLDVAVSTYSSMKVEVLLGDGKGHLAGGNSYPLGGNSFAIVAGDFNGDGKIDLAAGVNNIFPQNHVAIFLGDGSGAFTGAPDVPVPDVTGLTTADFNGDGNLDLAVATYGSSVVAIALGDGTGQFAREQELLLAHPHRYVYDVAAGDFNGDGKPDLATANYDTTARSKPGDAAVLLNVSRINITAPNATASEPGTDTGKFRITRTGCTSEALTVNYAVSGTATPGRDYVRLSGCAIIPAGKTQTNIELVPLDDMKQEGSETVIVSLSANPAYYIGGEQSATVVINDND